MQNLMRPANQPILQNTTDLSSQKIKPMKVINKKVAEQSKDKAWVHCISNYSVATQLTKEQIRIQHVHNFSLQKATNNTFQNVRSQSAEPVKMVEPQRSLSPNPFIKNNSNIQPFIGSPNIPLKGISNSGIASPNSFITSANSQRLSSNPFVNLQNPSIPIQNNMSNNFINSNMSNGFGSQIPNLTFNSNQMNMNNNSFMNNNNILNNQKNNINNMTGSFGQIKRQTSFGQIEQSINNQTPILNSPALNASQSFNNSIPLGNTLNQPNQLGNQTSGVATGASNTLFNQPTTFQTNYSSNINRGFQQTPSFGSVGASQVLNNLNQSNTFGASSNVNQFNSNFSFGRSSQNVGILPAQNQSLPNSMGINQPGLRQSSNRLQQNIRQLLDSKPNLWNILSLDPNFSYGYNEYGRLYIKSVLQRIIDQQLLSQDKLNTVLIEIYKAMYGQESVQKMLQNKNQQKNSLSQLYNKFRQHKVDQLIKKQQQQKNTQSAFIQRAKQLTDDAYRSFKRYGPSFFNKQNQNQYQNSIQRRMNKSIFQRKYLTVKRQNKMPKQLKIQFVQQRNNFNEYKRDKVQCAYSKNQIQRISDNIRMVRNQQRCKIMPQQQDLPDITGFNITPSLNNLRKFTKYQLLSVPKVSIQNEFGILTFKAPISLYRKKLSDLLVINQKQVQIFDQEWKVRDAQIKFKRFVDISQMDQGVIDQLQEKIIKWCQENNYQLRQMDRDTGEVTLWI